YRTAPSSPASSAHRTRILPPHLVHTTMRYRPLGRRPASTRRWPPRRAARCASRKVIAIPHRHQPFTRALQHLNRRLVACRVRPPSTPKTQQEGPLMLIPLVVTLYVLLLGGLGG